MCYDIGCTDCVCGFEGISFKNNTARWLSWLERRPVTAEVVGSNPIRVGQSKSNKHTAGGVLYWRFFSFCFYKTFGILAQLGEHLPYKQRVTGSSPVGPIPYIDGFWMDSRVAKGDRL